MAHKFFQDGITADAIVGDESLGPQFKETLTRFLNDPSADNLFDFARLAQDGGEVDEHLNGRGCNVPSGIKAMAAIGALINRLHDFNNA